MACLGYGSGSGRSDCLLILSLPLDYVESTDSSEGLLEKIFTQYCGEIELSLLFVSTGNLGCTAMKKIALALATVMLLVSSTKAQPLTIHGGPKKEPVYQTAPKYLLLAFGPNATARVWLVLDGDTLFVDRNGNGDLTEPGEKIAPKLNKNRDPAEFGYEFKVGDVKVDGKVHKGLTVYVKPLSLLGQNPALPNLAPLQAALKADPKAQAASLGIDVESAELKGNGLGGRLSFNAGFHDEHGVLLFADEPRKAPIVHLGGPLSVTFYGQLPKLRQGREDELYLAVGTPGRGPGSLAMLAYEGTIPEKAYPRVEIVDPVGLSVASPRRERFELKERC
jgi:hypothetical protein